MVSQVIFVYDKWTYFVSLIVCFMPPALYTQTGQSSNSSSHILDHPNLEPLYIHGHVSIGRCALMGVAQLKVWIAYIVTTRFKKQPEL